MELKRQSVRILEFLPRQETTDLLLHCLSKTEDHAFRFVMISALNRLHDKNSNIKVNRFLIKSEIVKEIHIFMQIQTLQQFYTKHPESTSEYLEIAFKALLDESLERIFRFLDLLYPYAPFKMIYGHLTWNYSDANVRTQALELLHNTIEPSIMLRLQRIFEERPSPVFNENAVRAVLIAFLKSEDRWFSFVSYFVMRELALSQKWPEFENWERQSQTHRFFETS